MRRAPRPPRIYGIADAEALAPRSLADGAAAMAEAGLRWIQLRAKRLPGGEYYRQVVACARRLAGSDVALWLDDRVDLAALVPVAGVHLGQEDLPPLAARRILGEEVWIGRSTHDEAQASEAARDADVDLVAVGPIYATGGKQRPDPVVGVDLVRRARRLTAKPLVAIGGISAENLAEALAAGADAVAVLGALCRGDVAANARILLAAAESAEEAAGPRPG